MKKEAFSIVCMFVVILIGLSINAHGENVTTQFDNYSLAGTWEGGSGGFEGADGDFLTYDSPVQTSTIGYTYDYIVNESWSEPLYLKIKYRLFDIIGVPDTNGERFLDIPSACFNESGNVSIQVGTSYYPKEELGTLYDNHYFFVACHDGSSSEGGYVREEYKVFHNSSFAPDAQEMQFYEQEIIYSAPNAPPTLEALSLTDYTPEKDITLFGYATFSDLSADTISVSYRWYQDESIVASGSKNVNKDENTYISARNVGSEKNVTWKLSVRGYDGENYSAWFNSTGAVVQNSVPTISEAINATDVQGTSNVTITATGEDEDGYEDLSAHITYSTGNCTLVDSLGASDSLFVNYTCELTVGINSNVSITFNDTEGESVSTQTLEIDTPNQIAPVLNTITLSTDTPEKGGNLSALVNISDEDTTPLTIQFKWYKNDIEISNGSIGSTSNAITNASEIVIGGIKNDTYIFSARAFDGQFYSNWSNSSGANVSNSAPLIQTDISATNQSGSHNISITATGSDADGYSDISPSVDISTGTCSLVNQTQEGDTYFVNYTCLSTVFMTVNVSINFTDGSNSSVQTSIREITFSNNAPYVSDLIVSANETNLSCDYTFNDADNDADYSQSYKWYEDGILVASSTKIVDISDFAISVPVVCSVNVSDSYSDSGYTNSSALYLDDVLAPEISAFSMPSEGETGEIIDFNVNCSDANEIALSYPKLYYRDPNSELKIVTFTNIGGDSYEINRIFSLVGTYTNFSVYCKDGSNNQNILESNNTMTLSAPSAPSSGGGGGSTSTPSKKSCDIDATPEFIEFTNTRFSQGISLKNNEDFSVSFKYQITSTDSEFKEKTKVIVPITTLVSKAKEEFGVEVNRFYARDYSGSTNGTLVISSDECSDIKIPLQLDSRGELSVLDIFTTGVSLEEYLTEPVWRSTSKLRSNSADVNFAVAFFVSIILGLLAFSSTLIAFIRKKSYGQFISLVFVIFIVFTILGAGLINLLRLIP
jgi:hypothetical protein